MELGEGGQEGRIEVDKSDMEESKICALPAVLMRWVAIVASISN